METNKTIKPSKLLVVIPSRYYIDQEGVWTTTSYNYEMWTECLGIWDEIKIAGLCLQEQHPKQATRADGPSVTFVPIQNSKGALRALKALPKRFIDLYQAVKSVDAVVLHGPSDLATLAFFWARLFRKPCGLDVRGSQSLDAKYLRLKGFHGAQWMTTIFAWLFAWVRKYSHCAIYVSKGLQQQFPMPSGRPTWVASDIRIPDWWFSQPRDFIQHNDKWHLCSVGRLEEGKAYGMLLQAYAQLSKQLDSCITLEIIGTGPLEHDLRAKAQALGIADRVTFAGFVPWGPLLHERLRQADLFVLTSVSEGMPRVLLEAMAVGLPAISTDVGGASELLSAEEIVPINNIEVLTNKLFNIIRQPARLTIMAHLNNQRIQDFRIARLREAKQEFYKCLHQHVKSTLS